MTFLFSMMNNITSEIYVRVCDPSPLPPCNPSVIETGKAARVPGSGRGLQNPGRRERPMLGDVGTDLLRRPPLRRLPRTDTGL